MSDSYPERRYFKGGLGSRGLGFIPQGNSINLAGATSSSRSKEIQCSGALLTPLGSDSKQLPTCAGSFNINWSFQRAEARALNGIVTLKLRSLASVRGTERVGGGALPESCLGILPLDEAVFCHIPKVLTNDKYGKYLTLSYYVQVYQADFSAIRNQILDKPIFATMC